MIIKNICSIGAIFLGMFVATLFPVIGTPVKGLETPLLMVILFVSLLGISVRSTVRFVKDSFWYIILITFCKLIVLPLIIYFLFKFIWPDFAVAALLIAGISTGVSAPFVALLAGGNRGFVVVLVVLTSLCCVFSLPLLVRVLLGGNVEIDALSMLIRLGIVVFIPLICSEIVQAASPVFVKIMLSKSFIINTALFCILAISVFSQNAEHLRANPVMVLEALAVDFIVAFFAFVCALIVYRRFPLESQIGAMVILVSINNFLVVVLANHFFGFREIIVSALYSVPFFLVVIPAQLYRGWYIKRKGAPPEKPA